MAEEFCKSLLWVYVALEGMRAPSVYSWLGASSVCEAVDGVNVPGANTKRRLLTGNLRERDCSAQDAPGASAWH